MHAFNYHRPKDLSEAAALLADCEDGTLIAGGQSLLPTLRQRLATPSDLIDLGGIERLRAIQVDDATVTVGATACHADVGASPDLRRAVPALADLAAGIGDPLVRNRGTIGGSIANNDPAACYPAAVLGLGGTVETNERTIDADDFFQGLFETALEPGEIVRAVCFDIPERAAYVKFPQPASRFALVGVFVSRKDGQVRVAVTGAGPVAFRAEDMEQALTADFRPEALDGITVDPDGLNDDLHGTPAFRAHLIGVMARRAVAAAGA